MTTALIFDTELTDRKEGEIIEAAWLSIAPVIDLVGECDRIDPQLTIGNDWHQRFRPSKQITFGSMAVHHILPHELDDCAPSSAFQLPPCDYLVGHSIDFDWEAAGRPDVKRIDTHAIAQWLWPEATGYSQSALTYMCYGATPETREILRNAHGAMQDCLINHGLLRRILALNPEIETWSQLWEYSEECRIPRTCPLKRWDGVLLDDMETGAIRWCLDQHWLDPYFHKGLERVMEKRLGGFRDAWDRYED